MSTADLILKKIVSNNNAKSVNLSADNGQLSTGVSI
jgi:hypothetical protein